MAEPQTLPTTVLTGFLGSGKTTLLRRALVSPALADTAVVINEIGEIAIDHHLVDFVEGSVLELPGGCLCCAVREDLARTLRSLLDRREAGDIRRFRRIVVETTGLADPAPILFTLGADPMLDHSLHLARVVTLIDAVNGAGNLDRFAEAKVVAENHFARGFDSSQVHQLLLRVAWMEGDEEDAEKQIRWYTGNPEEYRGIEDQAAQARMLGQLRRSRKFLEKAAELARGRALPDVADRLVAPDANGDALLGSCTSALKTRPAFVTLGNNLAILAFCGDEAMMQRAEKRIEEISRWRGGDPLWTEAQLPQVRAAM